MPCAESLRVQAYFDGELDAVSAADIERHMRGCAECRALLEELRQLRTALRRDWTLRDALRRRCARGSCAPWSRRSRGARRATVADRLGANLATAAVLEGRLQRHSPATAIAASIAFFLLGPPPPTRWSMIW